MRDGPKDEKLQLQRSRLLLSAADSAYRAGLNTTAERILCKVTCEEVKLFKAEASDVLDHAKDLGCIVNRRGGGRDTDRPNELTEVSPQVTFSSGGVSMLGSMGHIAFTKRHLELCAEADALQSRVLEIHKSIYGVDDHSTLRTMRSLAKNFYIQGHFNEAELLETRILQRNSRKLGPEHPDTLCTSNILADIYARQKRFTDAEMLVTQVLSTRKRIVGPSPEHDDILSDSLRLAQVYFYQSQFEKAGKLQLEVLEQRRHGQRPRDLLVLYGWVQLAKSWRAQRHFDMATDLMRWAVDRQLESLGRHHPTTVGSVTLLDA